MYVKKLAVVLYLNFPVSYGGYSSAGEFIIVGRSRHEKELVTVCGVYGVMFGHP